MKKFIILILIGVAFYQYTIGKNTPTDTIKAQNIKSIPSIQANHTIASAYKNKQSDVQVNGSGTVIKLLRDDNEGSRHQKFILRLASGKTVLIAHNIDLAPRINSISKGDQVQFYGEYEWNNKGGVVHWTHHDPSGRHIGGWLKHNGSTYK